MSWGAKTADDDRREAVKAGRNDGPRICMPTWRGITKRPFRCSLYEAEDVLAETNAVDMLTLRAGPRFPWMADRLRRLLYHDLSRKLMFVNPGLEKVRLNQKYDLFVAVFQNYWDLLFVNAIEDWKDQCKVSVCWIDELWANSIPGYKHWLHALSQFDHVFVMLRGSVKALSDSANRRCQWLAAGVDALRFAPDAGVSNRPIDVYSIGRRWEGVHQALRQAAKNSQFWYVYDTCDIANAETYDHRQHREAFANIAKRSRYFLVAPAKMDATEDTLGQIEMGTRNFEGAAAGAVLIGESADCEAFRETFPWPDAVVDISPDGSDVTRILAELDADPERTAAVRARNTMEILLRHDWVYRWNEIFRVCGLESSDGMKMRQGRLQGLADQVGQTVADTSVLPM
jgi:Glycosyl transferases group 1